MNMVGLNRCFLPCARTQEFHIRNVQRRSGVSLAWSTITGVSFEPMVVLFTQHFRTNYHAKPRTIWTVGLIWKPRSVERKSDVVCLSVRAIPTIPTNHRVMQAVRRHSSLSCVFSMVPFWLCNPPPHAGGLTGRISLSRSCWLCRSNSTNRRECSSRTCLGIFRALFWIRSDRLRISLNYKISIKVKPRSQEAII